jgi:hypothetical protein
VSLPVDSFTRATFRTCERRRAKDQVEEFSSEARLLAVTLRAAQQRASQGRRRGRTAELGFFGLAVKTRTQTPRFCGQRSSRGDLSRRLIDFQGVIRQPRWT